jgi:hypothetical protein
MAAGHNQLCVQSRANKMTHNYTEGGLGRTAYIPNPWHSPQIFADDWATNGRESKGMENRRPKAINLLYQFSGSETKRQEKAVKAFS